MASSSCGNFCTHEFRKYHLTLDYVSPYDFVTFQCGCNKLYVVWRILWALYHLVWIILTGVYSYQWAGDDPSQQVKWFIYLTDWAYFTLTLATIVDAICVIFVSLKRDDIVQDICPIMPWYLKLDWILFNISNTISVLMSIMYWSLIYTSSADMTAVNIETHALNMVYVIINLMLTGIPVRFYHFFHSMIFGFIYVMFSVIYEVSGGTNHKNMSYIYSVLDWTNTTYTAMLSLIVVIVAIPVCHMIIFLLHLVRIYLNKKCCSRNKRSITIITPDRKDFPPTSNGLELNHSDEVKISMASEVKEDVSLSYGKDKEFDKEHLGLITEQNQKDVVNYKSITDQDHSNVVGKDENVDEENNIKLDVVQENDTVQSVVQENDNKQSVVQEDNVSSGDIKQSVVQENNIKPCVDQENYIKSGVVQENIIKSGIVQENQLITSVDEENEIGPN